MATEASVGLSKRQHQMLTRCKDMFEQDFGKRVSQGEFIAILAQGYLEGREIIEKHSEYVVAVSET
jgi:hypothetical protein